jgi:iron-sulfur cluster repair protein YtfE (RIC family)
MSDRASAGRHSAITAEMRIEEIVRLYPAAVRVFHDLGVEARANEERTIREAAAHARLEIDDVLALLNRIVSDGVAPGS